MSSNHAFAVVRTLPCDVPLAPNPFIDPSGCRLEAGLEEAMFKAILAEQQKAESGR
jgi:hypothetical protein